MRVRRWGHWPIWAGLAVATVSWAVLFYLNYWDVAVPAYGSIETHLAGLRVVLWKYTAAAVLLAAGWLATSLSAPLRASRGQGVTEMAERMREDLPL